MRVFIVTGDIFRVCDSLDTALKHIIGNEMGWGRKEAEVTETVMADFERSANRVRNSWETPWGEPNSVVHIPNYAIQMVDVLTN